MNGDLFLAPASSYFAHCISSDFALGRGIAVEFERRYNLRRELNQLFICGDCGMVGRCVLLGPVFNLITKQFYWGKPTYDTLRNSLISMRRLCSMNNITEVSMPRIGCGLDRLEWDRARNIIQDVFYSTDIEITVYVMGRELS